MSRTAMRRTRGDVQVLVGTRKGAWFLRSNARRQRWSIEGPQFLGHIVHHVVLDPRDGKTMLAAARTGHLGPTIFRSTNAGRTWTEARRAPAFPRVRGKSKEKPRVVDHTFWLQPGLPGEPGVWLAATSPAGLFRSEDGGNTWEGVKGFNQHPKYPEWLGQFAGTPDGQKLHSVAIDPRDSRHMYVSASGGGTFETLDGGKHWKPLNKGVAADFMPVKDPEYGHDPHCMVIHPANPDRLYQQNHCGIYRLDRPSDRWIRIGNNMPRKIGDIGFPMVPHPRDADTVWVFPMDGGSVWPRVSVAGKPVVYRTRDAGRTWEAQTRGLPAEQAWFTVKRQAMSADAHDPVGLYFGTTSGEVWASRDEGASWNSIASHLPHIYSVVAAAR